LNISGFSGHAGEVCVFHHKYRGSVVYIPDAAEIQKQGKQVRLTLEAPLLLHW